MNKLKELRIQKGYSQRELSNLTGIKIKTIQNYEQGTRDIKNAPGSILRAVSHYLQCSIKELIGDWSMESIMCFEHHKKACEKWEFGHIYDVQKENGIITITYGSGTYFNYRVSSVNPLSVEWW